MAWLVSRLDPRISVAICIVLGLLVSVRPPALYGATALTWLGLATLLLRYRRHRTIRSCALLGLALVTGLLYVNADALQNPGLFEGTIASTREHRFVLCRVATCIQVDLPREHAPDVHVGDDILVRGHIRTPRPPRNPHDLDERQLALTLGVVGFVDRPAWIRIKHDTQRFSHRIALARRLVEVRIRRRVAHEVSASILTALLTGSRSSLDGATRQQFSQSGLSHVLAVSGLHIGLLAVIMLALARSLFRRFNVQEETRRALSGILAIVAISLIAIWMGATPSVSRAALMGLVLFGAFARRERYSPWMAWWWALAAGLMASPSAWKTAGFSLSFAAVGAILLFLPTLSLLRSRPWFASIVVSAVATLGTAPLLAIHMGQVPLSGAIISPFVIPLMPAILVMGAATLLDPGPLSAWVADLLVTLLRHAALWGSRWPEWSRFSGLHVIIWPWILLLICTPASRRSRVRKATAALIVAGAAITIWPIPPPVQYTQLDIGQGDATVIILSGKYAVVLDTGISEFSGRTIERHLRSLGQRNIDLLIHSHPHADHTGGSHYLASVMPIARFVDNTMVHRGDTLNLSAGARLYALHPPKNNRLSINEASLVLRLQVGPTSFLLMGDAEQAAERTLVATMGALLDTDILKVGHHGSRSSSTLPFVLRTTPRTAVVSAGRRNRFGHPHEEILRLWRSEADSVHVTAERGAFSVIYENGDLGIFQQDTR